MNRQVPKTVRSVLIFTLCILLFLTLLPHVGGFVYRLIQKYNHSDYQRVPPLGYAKYIVHDITGREDYQNADINERMDLFYDFLIDISKNGYEVDEPEGEDYYELVLYPEEIIVDRDNNRISFCEHYNEVDQAGRWFDYDFSEEHMIVHEQNAAIHELIDN